MNSRTVSTSMQAGRLPVMARRTIVVLVSMGLVALAAFILWQARPLTAPVVQAPNSAHDMAQNPELSAAARFQVARYPLLAEWILARNPELSAAARYNAGGEASDEAVSAERFLAKNPELSAARRFAALQGAQ